MTRTTAEIAIVGGGLVGGALAAALGSAGMEIVLIDREPPSQLLDATFDGRASAIALAPQRMLERIGVWGHLPEPATPILDIRVSDGASRLFLHYDSEEVGTPALGYMVENRHMRRALLGTLATLSDVRQIVATVEARDGHRLFLSDGSEVDAPLIVGADGANSQMRALAGIHARRWAYPQTGIVCTVRHARPHHNVAHEHFLPAGPFAILPLSGNRSSLVWTERAQLAPDLIQLPKDDFLAELARRFGDFLGDLALEGPIWSYPLSLHLADTAVAERLALVGDAAHGMHPIAGQGFNLGLRDVAALAETVVDAARLGLDIGAGTVLKRYAEWRRLDTIAMLGITDLLNRLFSNDVAPVRLARDIGLAAVDRMAPVKRFLMRHAMGMSASMTGGTLPRLLKGEAL